MKRPAILRTMQLTVLLAGLCCAAGARAADAPAWLKQAAAAPVSEQPKGTSAIVLLHEGRRVVEDNGRVTSGERGAIKVLTRDGYEHAFAQAWYLTDNSMKVKEIRAWLIRPSGQVREYGKGDVVDRAAALEDVYNEVRLQVIAAGEEAEPGSVFGYEWVVEDRSIFTQDEWHFQRRLPVTASRFSLSLPAGWQVEAVTFNHDPVQPTIAGTSWMWELRNLKPIAPEPSGPPVTNLAPRLAISYFPPATGSKFSAPTFRSWQEVSKWLHDLCEPQSVPNSAMAAKTRELAAGASSELGKIKAIGRYVQGVNYIAIQTGLGRGGGYRPHAAADVFAKSYGDCKDKANLMRAMLKSAGVDSYLVSIYSGDPTYVREEWASPQQFNHCIIAVKVGEETNVASVVAHPVLGRLLVFDPTDPHTPLGDLPDHEQGSLALVVAPGGGSLVRIPVIAPEANHLERTTDARLTEEGHLTARITEKSIGGPAVAERRMLLSNARAQYDRLIETWIARDVTGARVVKIAPADDFHLGSFRLDVEFSAERYAQIMQGRLFVFKPAIISRLDQIGVSNEPRTQPIVLDARSFSETARIQLPAGFAVDELPEEVVIETRFGTYSTSYRIESGSLVFSRRMTVRQSTVPPADLDVVRAFFGQIRAAEQAPAVLVRK